MRRTIIPAERPSASLSGIRRILSFDLAALLINSAAFSIVDAGAGHTGWAALSLATWEGATRSSPAVAVLLLFLLTSAFVAGGGLLPPRLDELEGGELVSLAFRFLGDGMTGCKEEEEAAAIVKVRVEGELLVDSRHKCLLFSKIRLVVVDSLRG